MLEERRVKQGCAEKLSFSGLPHTLPTFPARPQKAQVVAEATGPESGGARGAPRWLQDRLCPGAPSPLPALLSA